MMVDVTTDAEFDALVAAERDGLIRLAFVLSGSAGIAEEVVQEALLAAFQRWDRLAGYDRPGAWLRRVVINKAVSARRRNRAEHRALQVYAGSVEVGRLDPQTEEVWSEVRALPKRQAQTIALFYVEGLSYLEIGTLLGCGEATVKTHLRRARETLAGRLGDAT